MSRFCAILEFWKSAARILAVVHLANPTWIVSRTATSRCNFSSVQNGLILILNRYMTGAFARAPGNSNANKMEFALRFRGGRELLTKIARQGKVSPLITKGGLKSDGYDISIGLKSGPVGSTIQIAK
jgi:hypothetical protein